MIDTDTYIRWLLSEAEHAGCEIVHETLRGDLRTNEQNLRARFGVDAVVNCTGLGARTLVNDAMYPLQGAVIRVHNDGQSMPKITGAHCVTADASEGQGFVFILPRGEDMLLLGGFAEPGVWDLDVTLDSHQVRQMFDRCVEFLPQLQGAKIDATEPVRAGLRPYAPQQRARRP